MAQLKSPVEPTTGANANGQGIEQKRKMAFIKSKYSNLSNVEQT